MRIYILYRHLRVYGIENKFRCLHSISKLSVPDQVSAFPSGEVMLEFVPVQDGESRQCRMWIDERLNSFFRRLSFTPDGSFLIAPGM